MKHGYGSDYEAKEGIEVMDIKEVARSIEYLRALGLTDTQICDCIIYVTTGVGLLERDKDQ